MSDGWKVHIDHEIVKHVIPVNDSGKHVEESLYGAFIFKKYPVCPCSCKPRLLEDGGGPIFVHNSFDGREGIEWTKDILSQ
jgi:hypothetical protein